MSDNRRPPRRPATQLTHSGRDAARYCGFVNTPPYRGSTVLFESAEDFRAGRGPRGRYRYGRHHTPTTDALTEALINLDHGAAYATLTPSGLMAISLALLAVLRHGDHILVADSVYHPTRAFCNDMLARYGITTTYYDPLIGAAIEGLITPQTRLLYLESPGSGTFEIQDIPMLAAVARKHDIITVCDNTWATPLYFNPLTHGVDISIQSLTKYIAGHSDVMAGAITALAEHSEALELMRQRLGVSVSADDVFLTLRGLRTLEVRLERHERTALELAQWFGNRPEIVSVLHPALAGASGHDLWKRDFSGASGLFAVVLDRQWEAGINALLNNLDLFGMGYSWGGFESLMIPVSLQSVRTATPVDRGGAILRIHAGLEDIADLIADLEQGFQALRAAASTAATLNE